MVFREVEFVNEAGWFLDLLANWTTWENLSEKKIDAGNEEDK